MARKTPSTRRLKGFAVKPDTDKMIEIIEALRDVSGTLRRHFDPTKAKSWDRYQKVEDLKAPLKTLEELMKIYQRVLDRLNGDDEVDDE